MSEPFLQNLVESSHRGISRRSVAMKALAAGLEVAGLVALIVIPLLMTDALPAPPSTVATFLVPPAPPPPPPLPLRAARRSEPKAHAKPVLAPRPIPSTEFVAPMSVPDEVMEKVGEDAGFAGAGDETPELPDGSFDGVVGGIPGAPPKEPVRVGGEVQPPKKLEDAAPVYPPTARAARVEGAVVLEAIIDSRGVVSEVRVLKSIPLLDDAALEAVKKWRYEATRLNGVAVPVVMTVTVQFALA
jgi:periplasmic protein TonB